MKTPKIIRPSKLTLHLPEDVRAKLDLHLYSEVEGRIPFGAYQRFLSERINEYFAQKRSYLSDKEAYVVRRVLYEVVTEGDSNQWSQETWQDTFGNGQEAYLLARELSEKLK